ncbi:enolase C-terminal domain-like protein [Parapedobacter tibetensis]|uniref:enolase C-terminal domain-like protein n=1 Tax=Parapedobacter tibetensis TaxID=2972951 RepID=UPI00214D7ADA|nr:enolase C-terminal domain-like protein [Parapedobacter tibetensis]
MIQIANTDSAFESEPLRIPFGFKGAYLTTLWQVICRLVSPTGDQGIGLATQSALYADAELFAQHGEEQSNAWMYALVEKSLQHLGNTRFEHPVDMMEKLLPLAMQEAVKLTGKRDLHTNFSYNALVSIDYAAWQLYAKAIGHLNFFEMIPQAYKAPFSYRNSKIGIMFQISYDMPLEAIEAAVDEGYFIFKIKTGHPGNQAEMLEKDMARLTQIHEILKERYTPHTPDGFIRYTMDANGRYERKDTLLRYLDHARQIGAQARILFYEEPFSMADSQTVDDIDMAIAGDERIFDEQSALESIQLGYNVIVLKSVAKTLSTTLKIAKIAYDHGIPCVCSDLTVNPILVEWQKNLIARLAPFPAINMAMIETNGDSNYTHWLQMLTYHPCHEAPWTVRHKGAFYLDDTYYACSGGIFKPYPHYERQLGGFDTIGAIIDE